MILVVDDEISIAELTQDMLELEGYQTRIATNGDEALAAVARERPDLIVSDVMMPGMDGITLCQTLGQDPTTRDIPVIFVSAVQRFSSAPGCYVAAFIEKPFEIDDLLQTVRRVLAARRARGKVAGEE
jgi:CheY-like chemotaxis protein